MLPAALGCFNFRTGESVVGKKNEPVAGMNATMWYDLKQELIRHPGYGQAERRKLGQDLVGHGRFVAIEGRV